MDNKLLLVKSITLLYRESQLPGVVESSAELVRTVLESVKTAEIGLGINSDNDVIEGLKITAMEMCANPPDHEYEKADLVQQLAINTEGNEKLYKSIVQGIEADFSEPGLKRSILNTRRTITNHFREQQVNDVLNKASYAFKYQREKIKDTNMFIAELMAELEPLQLSATSKDPAVVDDIDVGDDVSLHKLFENVKKSSNGGTAYKTGWKALNTMLQGGVRPGLTVIGALQHKYKTGFTLSLFKQIALYNKPHTEDTTKKPLLLRISFEDDLELNIQFLYQSLKYDETREDVDLKSLAIKEMADYIKERLQVNGFHIKLLRVDPSLWTYRSICNKIVEYEAEGYAVEVVMMDYLSKVPTTGCNGGGIIGQDLSDMFSRMRNFFSAKGICGITPHQMSTEAKQLIRGGIPEDQFVKEIAGKGYYERCKSLDQIVDCELYIHVMTKNKKSYLTVQRGKHRIPTIIPEDDKYFLLPFPDNMPIADDAEDEDQSMRKLNSILSNASDDLFSMDS